MRAAASIRLAVCFSNRLFESLVEFALRYCQVLIELAKPRQIAGGQLHPRRGLTAGPEEEIALLMRRWEQVKAGDGAVVLIGGEPGNREIAPRAAAHRVAEARRIVANQSSRSNEQRQSIISCAALSGSNLGP